MKLLAVGPVEELYKFLFLCILILCFSPMILSLFCCTEFITDNGRQSVSHAKVEKLKD